MMKFGIWGDGKFALLGQVLRSSREDTISVERLSVLPKEVSRLPYIYPFYSAPLTPLV